MTFDPNNDPDFKPFGEARKQIEPGNDCPNDGCEGMAEHQHDKDEGPFVTRVTECDTCEDWWKYNVPRCEL